MSLIKRSDDALSGRLGPQEHAIQGDVEDTNVPAKYDKMCKQIK